MNNYLKQIWYELRHQPMVTIHIGNGHRIRHLPYDGGIHDLLSRHGARRAGNKPAPSYVPDKTYTLNTKRANHRVECHITPQDDSTEILTA